MDEHQFRLVPGTSKLGITARSLLDSPYLKKPQMKCPVCNTMVDIPVTLAQDIQDFANAHGGNNALVLLTLHHPQNMPSKIPPGAKHITDSTRLNDYKDAFGLK